ncbi:hypothetical protein QFZ77_004785 [Paenibacillus sp. V4I3]|uniref:hypothetical protein n=1 Tax=unclassified Paenibacillus TaxID=185978 RepID=UPI00277FEE02|nr:MULTISPECIES: hypothetical protein [unclassified Paenibacillus]MDQ0876126.1 hypothetical protein [Paenibacillus sp. V4I3]MDQ0887948.1 hypothetical protein [Paenibacillus sp. V4I9]
MKINYLITFDSEESDATLDELEYGGSVSGYFELVCNEECSYGCIPYLPIPADLQGLDLLSTWFEQISEAAMIISKTSDFVIINDIDSFNSWIEIQKCGEQVFISHIISEKKAGQGALLLKPLSDYINGPWVKQPVEVKVFLNEIIGKTRAFMDELLAHNKNFLNVSWVEKIMHNINNIEI